MKLEEARPKLREIVNIPFSQLYTRSELHNIKIAKGDTGKLLEKLLGLPPGCSLKDFEDGELKTNKSNANGKPKETMFISQISSRVDELFNKLPFSKSWIYQKINRMIYVPVVKESTDPNNWYFLEHYFIDIPQDSRLYNQLKKDYEIIYMKMLSDINDGDGSLHTSSGKYIQIRTKDGKPYNPIYSDFFKKYVSNKNFAFYFKKEFMIDVQNVYGEQ